MNAPLKSRNINDVRPPQGVDVAVLGGGAAGRTLSLAALAAGFTCAIFGKNGGGGKRWLALGRASVKLLESLGVWRMLPKNSVATCRRMTLAAAGEVWTLDAAACGRRALAEIVEESALLDVLARRLDKERRTQSAALFLGENAGELQSITAGTAEVSLRFAGDAGVGVGRGRDESEIKSRLAVAADGANSAARRIAGLPVFRRDYGQHALTAVFTSDAPVGGRAVQVFGRRETLALLPAGENKLALIWSLPAARAEARLKLDADALARAAQQAAQNAGVRVGNLKAAGAVGAFPLAAAFCPRVVKERLVLLGNAARVVHPLAGQGLNLAFSDIAALRRSWAGGGAGGDSGVGGDPGAGRIINAYAARHPLLMPAAIAATAIAPPQMMAAAFSIARAFPPAASFAAAFANGFMD